MTSSMRTNHLPTLALLLLSALVGGACAHRAGHPAEERGFYRSSPSSVFVEEAPPPVPFAPEPMTFQPEPNAVWVDGHWTVHRDRWVWVPGRWMIPGDAGRIWEPPVVIRMTGGYTYYSGYWRPLHREPPAAYRSPRRIRVHARPEPSPTRAVAPGGMRRSSP